MRYRGELLRLCRRMMGSSEDAEDVLQEVFAAAYVAILADERPIDCGPWLHRIARNRCLNKLRGSVTSEPLILDDEKLNGHTHHYVAGGGATAADQAHLKSELQSVVDDMMRLPLGQRSALARYALGGYSYDQIATDMDLSVASVRSLLLRARAALGEAAEAREISCAEVRAELQEKAGGHRRASAPVRRHVKACPSCARYGKGMRQRRRSLLALFPFGPGTAASLGSASGTVGIGSTAGGLSAGAGALAVKAAAGLVVLALAGAGAAALGHGGGKHVPSGTSAPVAPIAKPELSTMFGGSSVQSLHSHRAAFGQPRTLSRLHPAARTGRARTPSAGSGTTIPRRSAGPVDSASGASGSGSSQAVPLITQRTRPLPGSGATTERTRPAPKASAPAGQDGTTTTGASTTSSSETPTGSLSSGNDPSSQTATGSSDSSAPAGTTTDSSSTGS